MSSKPSTPPSRAFDPASASDRRRFFISHALRLACLGSGSDLRRLLETTPNKVLPMPFDGVPAMLIGAHAAAYAPLRSTVGVDYVVPFEHYAAVE